MDRMIIQNYFRDILEIKIYHIIDMSLSTKLNENAIQIKKKTQTGGDKKIRPMSQKYKKYLQGGSIDKIKEKKRKKKKKKNKKKKEKIK